MWPARSIQPCPTRLPAGPFHLDFHCLPGSVNKRLPNIGAVGRKSVPALIAAAKNRISWPVSRVLFMRRTALDDHSSGASVAGHLMQPTRTAAQKPAWGQRPRAVPIWFCSRWGLPCRHCCQRRGALLPHPFTLTPDMSGAVCFLWHFPWGHPRRALPGTVFPWSPDFPPPKAAAIRPADPLALGANRELRQARRNRTCSQNGAANAEISLNFERKCFLNCDQQPLRPPECRTVPL